ncbi:hypothetical protein [Prosthecobacter sp.]
MRLSPPKTRSDIVTAIRRGACDYVTKPYQPDGLRPGCGLKFDLGNFPPVTHWYAWNSFAVCSSPP